MEFRIADLGFGIAASGPEGSAPWKDFVSYLRLTP